ncbi:Uncharacterized protein Fot_03830 [Forsythia ovata]|uniref:Uncharacterized protein n=1 Tax=Forsythia ovata TaxID=205694 RepID=A0ABD1XAT7_9LAMI
MSIGESNVDRLHRQEFAAWFHKKEAMEVERVSQTWLSSSSGTPVDECDVLRAVLEERWGHVCRPGADQSPDVVVEHQDTVATQDAQLDAQSTLLADALAYIDRLNGIFA